MAGSIFAGSDESPGETIIYEGRRFKLYRGMGSVEAMQEGSKDGTFRTWKTTSKKLVPEGIVGRVPVKGNINRSNVSIHKVDYAPVWLLRSKDIKGFATGKICTHYQCRNTGKPPA